MTDEELKTAILDELKGGPKPLDEIEKKLAAPPEDLWRCVYTLGAERAFRIDTRRSGTTLSLFPQDAPPSDDVDDAAREEIVPTVIGIVAENPGLSRGELIAAVRERCGAAVGYGVTVRATFALASREELVIRSEGLTIRHYLKGHAVPSIEERNGALRDAEIRALRDAALDVVASRPWINRTVLVRMAAKLAAEKTGLPRAEGRVRVELASMASEGLLRQRNVGLAVQYHVPQGLAERSPVDVVPAPRKAPHWPPSASHSPSRHAAWEAARETLSGGVWVKRGELSVAMVEKSGYSKTTCDKVIWDAERAGALIGRADGRGRYATKSYKLSQESAE